MTWALCQKLILDSCRNVLSQPGNEYVVLMASHRVFWLEGGSEEFPRALWEPQFDLSIEMVYVAVQLSPALGLPNGLKSLSTAVELFDVTVC